ncbi:MAG TPA: flagellar FliJ family protein [Nitrospiraceae bacterium]|nr:flagellar FliJ family protein [Nitrospiraceae bacterium]
MNLMRLRSYRSQLELMLRMELAELDRVVETAITKRHALRERADQDLRHMLAPVGGIVSADDTAHQYDLWRLYEERIRHCDEVIAQARAQRDLKQAEVTESAREAKKLDILIMRQARRTRQIELRRDQCLLDEAASRRYSHPHE